MKTSTIIAAGVAALLFAAGYGAAQTLQSGPGMVTANNPLNYQTNTQVDAATGAVTATMRTKLGAITNSGHTTTPLTVSFTAVQLGGSTATQAGLVDPVSGGVPGVGAGCMFQSSSAALFPAAVVIDCAFTASGTVAIRAVPLGGIALGAQSFTGNVFWIW